LPVPEHGYSLLRSMVHWRPGPWAVTFNLSLLLLRITPEGSAGLGEWAFEQAAGARGCGWV
jgi:hypothetical protein